MNSNSFRRYQLIKWEEKNKFCIIDVPYRRRTSYYPLRDVLTLSDNNFNLTYTGKYTNKKYLTR